MKTDVSLRQGRRRSAVLPLIVLAFVALGWGTVGHLFINTHAVDNLPSSMQVFINARSYFGAHASDADNRKSKDPTEAPKHFIDIDWYPAFQNLTPNVDSLVALYGASRVTTNGILPWATVQTYDSLVASLKRGEIARAESIAADLGHYVGDGHQPLHVALNYDGQLTGNDGVHSRYETTMINTYAAQLSVTPVPALYVPNRFAYVMAYLLTSNSLSDSVIQADNGAKSVSGWNGSGSIPAAYTAELWNETRSLTLREMQGATVALADLWYSAWVDAGLIVSSAAQAQGRTLPSEFGLAQNYPNPFNPSTNIRYRLAGPGRVTLTVYSVSGAVVATLVSGVRPAGDQEVRFDASGLSSGVYIYRLQQGILSDTRKMLLVR
jgi:Secretion system C-terminal sorting domain/S1/P1 Nuclease